ncbi:MAG: DUF4190 domain-containing protein [Bdellovibrionales bacterium]|nr:DUF4190 domain-containing protein [Bdellovibrionales bacterium]
MTLTSTGILPLRYLVAVILGVSAIVLGHLARRQIRRAGGAFTGRGLSFLALCFGYAILSGIIGIGVLLFLFFHDVSRTFDDGSIADTSLQNSQELILGTRAIDLIESADVVEYPKEEHRTFEYSFLD